VIDLTEVKGGEVRVLHTRRDGSVEVYKGPLSGFLHFKGPDCTLEGLTLVQADDDEVETLDRLGYEFPHECEGCVFTINDYRLYPAPDCLARGCSEALEGYRRSDRLEEG